MSNKVHYFSFYLNEEMEKKREANHAGFTKVEYIKNTLLKDDTNINIVSTALGKVGCGFLGKRVVKVSDQESQIYLPTFRYKGRLFNGLTILFMRLQIILYVLLNVKPNDKVLIYHSLQYISVFNFIRKLKKFKLILEFNDLYYAVSKEHAKKEKKEKDFIANADAYLFMNTIAEKRFNQAKPYVISYGSYELPKRYKERLADSKIHVVYAGIIEDGRKAAELAVESNLYLDESFVTHILGFGSEQQLRKLEKLIKKVNEEKGYESVIFHGRLRGQDFTDFLHSCHIGISSHTYTSEEMESANYTFPSKIPTYISHGLHVVSPNIPCVVESPFSEFTTFYNAHNAKALAEAISNTNVKKIKKTPAQLMIEMDYNFSLNLKKIISS